MDKVFLVLISLSMPPEGVYEDKVVVLDSFRSIHTCEEARREIKDIINDNVLSTCVSEV